MNYLFNQTDLFYIIVTGAKKAEDKQQYIKQVEVDE